MRNFAEFIMQSKMQAKLLITFGMLLSFVPFSTCFAATVASLVMLRYGVNEWLNVTAIGCVIGLVLWTMYGSTDVWILLGTAIAAYVLRMTSSWSKLLIINLLFSAIVVAVFSSDITNTLDNFITLLVNFMQESNGIQLNVSLPQLKVLLISMIGIVVQVAVIAVVMFARYLQAILYNPGGFGKEIRSLRLHCVFALGLMAFIIASRFIQISAVDKVIVISLQIPLLVAALALIHDLVYRQKFSHKTLILPCVYTALLLPLTSLIFCLLAAVDSVVNMRRYAERI